MDRATQSTLQREAHMFFRIMHELADAKGQGDKVEIWWALDDLALHALDCKCAVIRNRAYKELERHRARFRIEGCTDRFGHLDAFWNLPPNPFPYIEPDNYDEAPDSAALAWV